VDAGKGWGPFFDNSKKRGARGEENRSRCRLRFFHTTPETRGMETEEKRNHKEHKGRGPFLTTQRREEQEKRREREKSMLCETFLYTTPETRRMEIEEKRNRKNTKGGDRF
jgi:hypothetical protein